MLLGGLGQGNQAHLHRGYCGKTKSHKFCFLHIIRRKNFLNDSVKKFRRFERQQQAGIIIPPLNQESTGLAGSESQLS